MPILWTVGADTREDTFSRFRFFVSLPLSSTSSLDFLDLSTNQKRLKSVVCSPANAFEQLGGGRHVADWRTAVTPTPRQSRLAQQQRYRELHFALPLPVAPRCRTSSARVVEVPALRVGFSGDFLPSPPPPRRLPPLP